LLFIWLSAPCWFLEFCFQFFQITWYYLTLKKQKKQGFTIIYLKKRSIPFSFFNLIFIGKQDIEENTQIIEHEKIHAKQIHTIDLLIAELLVAAMWFNPFIWMYKRELQQVHEFLADEGVLNSGVDQLEYQTLLVNHAAEGRLVAVSSNFSYSLIKKRIKMMSKKKTHGKAGVKLLLVVPVLLVLILGVSCANGQENGNNLVAAVSPTKMNVLYIGIDNPVTIGVTGADMKDVEATIDNGSISGENGNYVVRVKKSGTAKIIVKADGKVVAEQMFRVKRVPDPVAIVKGNWNKHTFTKQELIEARGIEVMLVNFDFDLKWEVESFHVAASYNGKAFEARKVDGDEFSEAQIDIIKSVPADGKIYIEDIRAKGPDGAIRDLGTITIKIVK
jgi:hypothetical protein